MKFETRRARSSAGWHLAQAVMLNGKRVSKGTVLDVEQALALNAAEIQVFKLEAGDLHEDDAATLLQAGLFGAGLKTNKARTGRVNALAAQAGLVQIDATGVHRFNAVTEALTLATLPPLQKVDQGDLVATLKVIPFAVSLASVEAAQVSKPLLRLLPFQRYGFSLIQTQPASVKPATLDKASQALAARLKALGSTLVEDRRVDHKAGAVAKALLDAKGDVVILFPGAATQDRRDVGPAGLELAGGQVEHLGMPVDPGNLLFTGAIGERPVIGAPGCARSVAFNGFDWVLERACAGLFPAPSDIQAMGIGGLLKEIPSRPLPRLKA